MSSPTETKMYDLDWFSKRFSERANLGGRRRTDPVTSGAGSKVAVAASVFDFPLEYMPGEQAEKREEDPVVTIAPFVVPANAALEDSNSSSADMTPSRPLACRACKCIFVDVAAMRTHFRSADHLNTLRQSTSGAKASRSAEIEGADSSDGSEDSSSLSSSSSEGGADHLNTIAEDEDNATFSEDRTQEYEQGRVRWVFDNVEGTRVLFTKAGETIEISVNECALSIPDSTHWEDYKVVRGGGSVGPWAALHYSLSRYRTDPVWAVMAMRSGRFAAAVFDGHTSLVHKTFRRYTVRAKAGGSQSSHDSAGRKARSAGAMLRRYGEQALLEDIRSLMKSWEQLLQSCSLILLSIPKTLRPSVFDKEKGSVIDRSDPRVRYVTFMTDKPTYETLKEIHAKCSQVLIAESNTMSKMDGSPDTDRVEGPESPQKSANKAVKEGARATLSNQDAWISCAESSEMFEILRQLQAARGDKEGRRRLQDAFARCLSTIQLVYRDDVSDLRLINTDDIDEEAFIPTTPVVLNREISLDLTVSEVINLPDSLENLSTALHVAADLGDETLITQLLRLGADPSRRDVRGRTPYILCKTKEARDAFRRFRAFCESRYDWSGAGVPDALTAEAEAAQREREKEKKRRAKQRKAEAAQQQPAPSVAMSTPAVITARVSSDEVATVSVSGKKTDAPSATVSKGKKEEPMCASCGQVLNKRTSVDVFDKKACGSECAVKLRRRIQAEAAEARLKGGSACK